MIGILVEIVKGIPTGEEFEVRDMLPEYWTYIDHTVRNKIGKAFKPTMLETGLAQLGAKRGNRQIYIRT
ncbi:MAG: DUF1413 domain-containing protein [Hespellia sp.]|nr:DUF1413 domain-containing protein [Hespellia sp.]